MEGGGTETLGLKEAGRRQNKDPARGREEEEVQSGRAPRLSPKAGEGADWDKVSHAGTLVGSTALLRDKSD